MTDTEARLGRPRDPSRDAAILGATLELLGEAGYERVTVRAIASRAGVGLATIYRRWATKEELVVDAVSGFGDFPPAPAPDGDPVETLVRLVSKLVEVLQGPSRGLIPNLIGQLPSNDALADALRERVVLPRLEAVATQFAAIDGVDGDRAAEVAEMIPASLFFQIILLGRTLSDDDVRRAVAVALDAASPSSRQNRR